MQTAASDALKGNGKSRGEAVCMPERCGLAEHKRHDWIIDAQLGVTVEQIQEPSYYAHIAKDFSPFDHIEVRAEDGAWIAYLIVLFAERSYAHVKLDRVIAIEEQDVAPAVSLKHKVEWKGPHHRWAVIRLSDSQMLQSQLQTKFEAETWMKEHERAMER